MAATKVFAIVVLAAISASAQRVNITSPIVTNWGRWGSMQRCPSGRQAQGFQLRTEPNQYLGDDTALNTIRLMCGDPFRPDTAVITGAPQGEFGTWGNVYTCAPGILTGFQLRSESNRGSGDDTAANNIRFFCSSLSNPNDYIQGDGMSWGDWTEAQRCYTGQGICGIQTQIELYMADDGDDTMLNNVRFECCNVNLRPAQAAAEAAAYPNQNVTTVADLKIFPGAKVVNIPQLRQALSAIHSEMFNKTQDEDNHSKSVKLNN